MSCEVCKWWDRDGKSGGFKDGRQICSMAPMDEGPDDIDIYAYPMTAVDGSGYYAALFTSPDHCCKAFEKEGKTPP